MGLIFMIKITSKHNNKSKEEEEELRLKRKQELLGTTLCKALSVKAIASIGST